MTNGIKRHLTFIFLVLVLVVGAQAGATPWADRFPWQSDLDQARSQAASQGKPMCIVFRCEP